MGARRNDEARLRRDFERAYDAHRSGATADTWERLGDLLAAAYDISREAASRIVGSVNDGLDTASFHPLSCWEHVVALDPSRALVWLRLGRRYFEVDDEENARRALTRAVETDASLAEAWNALGVLELPVPDEGEPDRARIERAEGFFRRAIEHDAAEELGWEPYLWLAEAAEQRRDTAAAIAWYTEAAARGDPHSKERLEALA